MLIHYWNVKKRFVWDDGKKEQWEFVGTVETATNSPHAETIAYRKACAKYGKYVSNAGRLEIWVSYDHTIEA